MVVRIKSKAELNASKKRGSKLLTAACAGLLTAGMATAPQDAVAQTGVFNESSLPGGDFSNSFATADVLPADVGTIFGAVSFAGGLDAFQFVGLEPGTTFGAVVSTDPSFAEIIVRLGDSAGNGLGSFFASDPATTILVPADGVVVGVVSFFETPGSYELNITATSAAVPEPGSGSLLALGAAGLLGLRRKKD